MQHHLLALGKADSVGTLLSRLICRSHLSISSQFFSMDSGKAFDKPLPSVEVLKKFQVRHTIDSVKLPAPPPLPALARSRAHLHSIDLPFAACYASQEKQAWYQKRQAEIGFSYLIGK